MMMAGVVVVLKADMSVTVYVLFEGGGVGVDLIGGGSGDDVFRFFEFGRAGGDCGDPRAELRRLRAGEIRLGGRAFLTDSSLTTDGEGEGVGS